MGIFLRLAASATAVWIATLVLPGITVTADSDLKKVGTYVAVAVLFGVVNAVLRPIIKFFGCAFYVFTLGLISVVVNGALLLLTSFIADRVGLGFNVASFWPDAVLGALVIGLAGWAIILFIKIAPTPSLRSSAPARAAAPPAPPPPPVYPSQYPSTQPQYPAQPVQPQYPAQPAQPHYPAQPQYPAHPGHPQQGYPQDYPPQEPPQYPPTQDPYRR